ncbi:MAG: hypothetical protein QM778_22005 [Myxococcales bacterium]
MSNNVAITVSGAPDLWQATDWQRLWLATRTESKRNWRSIALVPAGPGVSPEILVQIAVTLAHTGMVHVGLPIHVADGTRVTLDQLVPFSEGLAEHMREQEMMVLALSALSENVVSLPLAKAADCALLCVVLGEMSGEDAKKTVAQIGASHFIGSAVFRLPQK